jgi:YHS domain-containing protein
MGRLIIIVVLVMIVYFTVKSIFKPVVKPEPKPDFAKPEPPGPRGDTEDMVQDPECGTYIPIESAQKATIKGVPYYFCSDDCRIAYQKKLEGN